MLLVLVLLPQVVLARSAGITGVSGKQGMFCNQCHAGGTAPVVTLTGPAALMPGASATYTVTITGGAGARGGFNAAASAGTLMAGANARDAAGEVTHIAPLLFAMGSVAFSFTYVAPQQAGAVTLYAAGNSVNFNTTNQGDLAATTTLTVMVGMPGSADGGTAGEMDGGMGAADAGSMPGLPGGGGTGSGSGGGVVPLDDGGFVDLGGPAVVHGSGRKSAPGYAGGVVDGGCSAAGGVPFALAALLLALARRRYARKPYL